MQQDPEKIANAIDNIIIMYFKDEMLDFIAYSDIEIDSTTKLDEVIEYCEKNNLTNHIFYDLMVIKSAYFDSITHANRPDDEPEFNV